MKNIIEIKIHEKKPFTPKKFHFRSPINIFVTEIFGVLKVNHEEPLRYWAYVNMSLNLVNTVIGLSILTVICMICYRNYEKVITHRRRKNDEDDPLLQVRIKNTQKLVSSLSLKCFKTSFQYSVIAAFILAIFHLIEGIYFAANWNNNDGYACAELMKGDFRVSLITKT